jgi:thioredoxin
VSAALPAVDDATFDTVVLAARTPVLVDVWAPWCGSCRLLAPVLRDVAADAGAALRVVAVDADAQPELAERLGVRGLPTMVLFDRGAERLRLSGPRNKKSLLDELRPWLGDDVPA